MGNEAGSDPRLPGRGPLIRYVKDCGGRYWPHGAHRLDELPIPALAPPRVYPLRYAELPLPWWARDLGVNGKLLLPQHCVPLAFPSTDADLPAVDWWQAVFLMLSNWDEWGRETRSGCVHSYSVRLGRLDPRTWERAWVNRALLFLRRWAARRLGGNEDGLFGALPHAEIEMTHDVDAVTKNLALRAKTAAFSSYNALRHAAGGRLCQAGRKLRDALVFTFSNGTYDSFETIDRMERDRRTRGHFYVYAGTRRSGPALGRMLFDPSYRIASNRQLAAALRSLADSGHGVGLHQSFYSWRDAARMWEEKELLERALGCAIRTCRQHWLRFSFRRTWLAQGTAGLELDSSLGFNDRPGFRNSAALRFHPWDFGRQVPHAILSMPLVLMDSHLYDYQLLDSISRVEQISSMVTELKSVRGVASVLWHPHVLSPDFGWRDGFVHLLGCLQ